MKVGSIAECSILQYFWPALSDTCNRFWKPICGLFESGRFTQVLLYMEYWLLYRFSIDLSRKKVVSLTDHLDKTDRDVKYQKQKYYWWKTLMHSLIKRCMTKKI